MRQERQRFDCYRIRTNLGLTRTKKKTKCKKHTSVPKSYQTSEIYGLSRIARE